ncbi:MAG: penicillin-binding protein activator [Steroidobacteraceae bacterium]
MPLPAPSRFQAVTLLCGVLALAACAPMDSLRKPPPTRPSAERGPDAATSPSARPGARTPTGTGRIALLLPLSGRAASAGETVRNGFLDSFYAMPEADRPSIRVYDVAVSDAPSAYLQAAADGAQVIVGPLTRREVTALADTTDGRVTTLALNFLPEERVTPANFYQFALSPEDEARAVARRVVADGLPNGVTLLPANDWGRRVQQAFNEELSALGGMVLDSEAYAPGTTDFSEIIPRLMKLRSAGRSGGKRVYRPREDAGFVFLGGQPVTARLIRSQLRFNFSGRIPAYSLSDAYEPAGGDNLDLTGVTFPDMPWILDSEGPIAARRDAAMRTWRAQGQAATRLHAFGMDAFAVVMELRRGGRAFEQPLSGVTGSLRLDEAGRVRRTLEFAQVKDGRALPLPR